MVLLLYTFEYGTGCGSYKKTYRPALVCDSGSDKFKSHLTPRLPINFLNIGGTALQSGGLLKL